MKPKHFFILNSLSLLIFLGALIAAPSLAQVFPGDLIINELVATNDDGLQDEDLDFEDWFEIKNTTAGAISLNDIYATDDPNNLLKWNFPNIILPAGSLLVVFASGKDRTPTDGSNLHTNFRWERNGEFAAIVDSASTIIHGFNPLFPPQEVGFSYGLDTPTMEFRYLQPPTPGAENGSSTAFLGFLEEVFFDVAGGFYEEAFSVSISHPDGLAQIHYTIGGATPTETDPLFTAPISVTDTTVLRAAAFRSGFVRSPIGTVTYLFNQDEVVKSLPAISMVSSPDNFFGPSGVISNPQMRGRAWERPGNIELLFPDQSPGFNEPCGIRVHGGITRGSGRKSYRIYFREEYGENRLEFPLMPETEVMEFDRLVLRAGFQNRNPFVSDELTRRLQADMGYLVSHGTFVNLYINGAFDNFRNLVERYDRFFFRIWTGSDNEWDVLRQGVPGDGDTVVWNELLDLVDNADLTVQANYDQVLDRLDVINFIDYLLLNIEAGMNDWPQNNYTAARERTPGGKFTLHVWDAEDTFGNGDGITHDTIQQEFIQADFNPNAPIRRIFLGLFANADFRAIWPGRFRKFFYEDGVLTDSHIIKRYLPLREVILPSIPSYNSRPTNEWIPGRRHNVEKQLFVHGLLDRTGIPIQPSPFPAIAINEFMARNVSTIADEASEFDDWVELYNPNAFQVDLSGMFLTDNFSDTTRWEIPSGTVLDPFDFLLIWTDGDVAQGPLHAPFRLDGDGERIGLFDTIANGNGLIDSVEFLAQAEDISEGRCPDGVGIFERLAAPSPRSSNVIMPTPILNGTEYFAGRGARSMTIGDFNRDDFPDLAVCNFNFGTVSIFLNRGDGFFLPPQTTLSGRLGSTALLAGDFNKDGSPDLAVTNDVMLEHSLSVLIGDGLGGMSVTQTLVMNDTASTRDLHPRSILSLDMTDDGYDDLLVFNDSTVRIGNDALNNQLNLFVNQMNGQFLEAGPVPSGSTAFISPQTLVVGNFDADSEEDLVSVPGRPRLIFPIQQSLLLHRGLGGTSFASPELLPTLGTATLLSVVASDFNDDGFLDLAASNGKAGGQVHILLNDGSASFSVANTISLPGPEQLLVEDFDQDGDDDIAVANYDPSLNFRGSLQILFNQGGGLFTPSEEFHTADPVPFPTWIASDDFDKDGMPDLAVLDECNGHLTIFLNLLEFAAPTAAVDNWESLR